jgi:hypothetical protein
MSRTGALILFVAIAATGCRSAPEVPDWKPEQAYQTVANQLPRADFGWGEPPAIARMAASERKNRPAEPPPPPEILCNEAGFKLVVEVLYPRVFTISYDAIEDVSYTYCPFPNLIFCVVFPFVQVSEMRVVFDARKVPGFLDHVQGECDRLVAIGREVGFGGPYAHAEGVLEKLKDDAAAFGEGRVSVAFTYTTPVPPWIPYTAEARHAAEAFAWVKAHPHEPVK